jgi:hypothetical protein
MHSQCFDSIPFPKGRASRLLPCLVLAALAGCSVRAYEERLERTNTWFQYLNMLDENLESEWADTYGFGIRMRPPKPFALLPPPPAPTEEDPAPVDERHPKFLPGITELPGLIGAWQAPLPGADGGQEMAFLYVMGNHQRFLDKLTGEGGGPEPSEFLTDLEAMLQFSALGRNDELPERNTGDQDNTWYRETIPKNPRVEGFPRPKEFRAISFLPPEDRLDEFRGKPIRMQLFEYAPRDSVQLAVLMIYPVNVAGDPVLRLRMALETLDINEQPPRPQRTGDEAGGGQELF